MDLVQKYLFVPLDIFKEKMHNEGIKCKLDVWLAFLSCDSPDDIVRIVTDYPEFMPLYEHIYDICLNVKKVMGMFSRELALMDKNTELYMIDEMQKEISQLEERRKEMETKYQQMEADNQRLHEDNQQLRADVRKLSVQLEEVMKKIEQFR